LMPSSFGTRMPCLWQGMKKIVAWRCRGGAGDCRVPSELGCLASGKARRKSSRGAAGVALATAEFLRNSDALPLARHEETR
jgi:hypothetical protein